MIIKEANEIEEFLEEIYDPKAFENFKNQKNEVPLINNKIDELEKTSKSKDNPNNKEPLIIDNNIDESEKQIQNKEVIIKSKNLKKKSYKYITFAFPKHNLY